jgi:hypothetical protein
VVLLFSLQPAVGIADSKIFAEGVAAVIGGNKAAARDKAIDDALRKAVEQAVGTVVSSDTMSNNYQIIHDKIIAQTSGYVKKYSILSEKAEADLFRIKIEAVIGKDNLMDDLRALGLLQELKEKPKVMVLIDEEIGGLYGTTAWRDIGQAESTIMEKFINAGFTVVDPQTVKANISRDKALRILEGDNKAAAAEGLKYGSQIVITGKAFSKNAGRKLYGTNMQSIQATLQARVVRADTGKVISSRSARGVKMHIDEMQGGSLAIQQASLKLADTLMQDILNQWKKEVYGRSQEITLMVNGLASYKQLSAIKRFLKNEVQGIRGVHQRSFTSGVSELMLDYGGKSGNIADELAEKNFQGFSIEPTNITPNRLDVRVLRKR